MNAREIHQRQIAESLVEGIAHSYKFAPKILINALASDVCDQVEAFLEFYVPWLKGDAVMRDGFSPDVVVDALDELRTRVP